MDGFPVRHSTAGGKLQRRPLTLPEQIAEDIARSILSGEVLPGQRLGEVGLSDRYGVSRGPVRDAIRLLEKSGLVDIFPRRGAFITKIDANAICDMFNVAACVMGLAARYCALFVDIEGQNEIDSRHADLASLARTPRCQPQEFALACGRLGAALGRNCQSAFVKASMVDTINHSLWALIFREHAVDYLTAARRDQVARDWRAIVDKIRAGEATGAESLARALIYDNRDETLRRLRIPNSDPPDERRFLRERSGPPSRPAIPEPSASAAPGTGQTSSWTDG